MKRRHVEDLPPKTDPEQFGGGRTGGDYTVEELAELLCSRAGCGRPAHATWNACADEGVLRPLCAACDVELNRLALAWMGDPEGDSKAAAYAMRMGEVLPPAPLVLVPDRPLPDGWRPVGAVVIPRCIDLDGQRRMTTRYAGDVMAWEALGMVGVALEDLRAELLTLRGSP